MGGDFSGKDQDCSKGIYALAGNCCFFWSCNFFRVFLSSKLIHVHVLHKQLEMFFSCWRNQTIRSWIFRFTQLSLKFTVERQVALKFLLIHNVLRIPFEELYTLYTSIDWFVFDYQEGFRKFITNGYDKIKPILKIGQVFQSIFFSLGIWSVE